MGGSEFHESMYPRILYIVGAFSPVPNSIQHSVRHVLPGWECVIADQIQETLLRNTHTFVGTLEELKNSPHWERCKLIRVERNTEIDGKPYIMELWLRKGELLPGDKILGEGLTPYR